MLLLTALAGGFGAVARYGLDLALARRFEQVWVRLLVINVSGSALLGLLAGLGAGRLVSGDAAMVLGAGLLGGYTTFSAASLATVHLLEEHRRLRALMSSLGMVLTAVVAAAAGFAAGRGL